MPAIPLALACGLTLDCLASIRKKTILDDVVRNPAAQLLRECRVPDERISENLPVLRNVSRIWVESVDVDLVRGPNPATGARIGAPGWLDARSHRPYAFLLNFKGCKGLHR